MPHAVETIMDRLAVITGAVGFPGVILRDKLDPANASDIPCAEIGFRTAEVLLVEGSIGGAMTHRAVFVMDVIVEGSSRAVMLSEAMTGMAAIWQAIAFDRSLAINCADVELLGYGGDQNIGSEVGSVSLEIAVTFQTAIADLSTILD